MCGALSIIVGSSQGAECGEIRSNNRVSRPLYSVGKYLSRTPGRVCAVFLIYLVPQARSLTLNSTTLSDRGNLSHIFSLIKWARWNRQSWEYRLCRQCNILAKTSCMKDDIGITHRLCWFLWPVVRKPGFWLMFDIVPGDHCTVCHLWQHTTLVRWRGCIAATGLWLLRPLQWSHHCSVLLLSGTAQTTPAPGSSITIVTNMSSCVVVITHCRISPPKESEISRLVAGSCVTVGGLLVYSHSSTRTIGHRRTWRDYGEGRRED